MSIRALEGSAKRNSQVCWSLLIDKAMFSMQELCVQHGWVTQLLFF